MLGIFNLEFYRRPYKIRVFIFKQNVNSLLFTRCSDDVPDTYIFIPLFSGHLMKADVAVTNKIVSWLGRIYFWEKYLTDADCFSTVIF